MSQRVTGPNWLMVGEAAAMIDPLTSIGVTAALRNAYEAASIVTSSDSSKLATARALADYDWRVRSMAQLYNSAIESLVYGPRVRRAFGLRVAGLACVVLGYGTNTFYTRLRPTTPAKTAALSWIISIGRLWVRAWHAAGVLDPRRRDTRLEASGNVVA